METSNSRSFLSRKVAWLTLLLIAVVALALVLLPVWIIQPFRPQSQRGLELFLCNAALVSCADSNCWSSSFDVGDVAVAKLPPLVAQSATDNRARACTGCHLVCTAESFRVVV